MAIKTHIERQQAIHYINARLCRLGEQKCTLLRNTNCADEHVAYQVKIIDWKIDTLLDRLARVTDADPHSVA